METFDILCRQKLFKCNRTIMCSQNKLLHKNEVFVFSRACLQMEHEPVFQANFHLNILSYPINTHNLTVQWEATYSFNLTYNSITAIYLTFCLLSTPSSISSFYYLFFASNVLKMLRHIFAIKKMFLHCFNIFFVMETCISAFLKLFPHLSTLTKKAEKTIKNVYRDTLG